MLLSQIKSFFKTSVRFLIVTVLATILLISSAFPAAAATSRPEEGEANLNEIQKRTDDIAKQAPPSLKDVQKGTEEGGLNEVQGKADIEKMVKPGDAKEAAPPIVEEVKGFFSKDKDSR
jgi:hypothetical protein